MTYRSELGARGIHRISHEQLASFSRVVADLVQEGRIKGRAEVASLVPSSCGRYPLSP
jgi:hypothetical protein